MSNTTKFLLWIYFVAVCAIGAGHTFVSAEDPLFKNQPRLARIYQSVPSIRHRGLNIYAPQAQVSASRAAPSLAAPPITRSEPQANNNNQQKTQ
jgi:hypothetical protein